MPVTRCHRMFSVAWDQVYRISVSACHPHPWHVDRQVSNSCSGCSENAWWPPVHPPLLSSNQVSLMQWLTLSPCWLWHSWELAASRRTSPWPCEPSALVQETLPTADLLGVALTPTRLPLCQPCSGQLPPAFAPCFQKPPCTSLGGCGISHSDL